MRLPTKPRQFPTTTPTLRSCLASANVVATTSLLVAVPRTISRRRITCAGLKKCVPMTMCGRKVAAAISSISSVEAAIEGRLFGIYNEHRNSGVGAGHRNAATHRSSANNGGFADLVGASVFRYARNPGRGALREEGVDQRPRLIGCEALLDDFTFPFATFLEWHRDRCFDRIDDGERCGHITPCLPSLLASGRKN